MAKGVYNRLTPIQRFERFVIRGVNENDCWNWKGQINNGRGQFSINNKGTLNYRFSYEYYIEPIIKNMQINHLCNNSICSNPLHLYMGTKTQNIQDINWNEVYNYSNDRNSNIIKLAQQGLSYTLIGKLYKLTGQYVGRIVRGEKNKQKINIKQKLYEEQNGICNGCKEWIDWEFAVIDHIQPQSQGYSGYKDKNNLQMLCTTCNSIKSNGSMDNLINKLIPQEKLKHTGKWLSEDNVNQIRQLYNNKITQYEIAKRFGVARSTVQMIVTNKRRQK